MATAAGTPTAAAPASPIPTPSPASQREEPPLPEARQEVASAATGDRLLVAGGFDGNGQSRAEAFIFNGASWSGAPSLPLRLDHPSAAEFGGAVYLSGGFSSGPASARAFRFASGAWTELAPMHHARGAHALVEVRQKLYAIGGQSGGAQVAAVEVYDPQSGAWTDVAQLPAPRNHVGGFAYGALACAAGGRAPNVNRVDCLDTRSSAWVQLPGLPAPTSGAGAGSVLTDFPAVAGGEDSAESRLVAEVWRYAGDHWTSEPMLHPRHGIQLAAFHGRLWACGGADRPGYSATSICTSIAI